VQSPATITPTVHRVGTVIYKDEQELEKVERNDWLRLNMSKLTRPTADYPMYLYEDNKIIIQPSSLIKTNPVTGAIVDEFSLAYVRKPADVVWGYNVIAIPNPGAGAYTYNSLTSQNFEIDDTDQTEVILRVLMYMGIVIRDPQIVQAAAQQATMEEQNQKS
jgi:hypothetical protein